MGLKRPINTHFDNICYNVRNGRNSSYLILEVSYFALGRHLDYVKR